MRRAPEEKRVFLPPRTSEEKTNQNSSQTPRLFKVLLFLPPPPPSPLRLSRSLSASAYLSQTHIRGSSPRLALLSLSLSLSHRS